MGKDNQVRIVGVSLIFSNFAYRKTNVMKVPDEFFIPDNEIRLPEELDYSRVDEYIRSAEAFSRSSYQSVYIIDYFRQNFLYVSPNPMFLCGLVAGTDEGSGLSFLSRLCAGR